MPLTHYKAFGTEYFTPIDKAFRAQPGVSSSKVHLVANVVSPLYSIEKRASLIKQKVEAISNKHNSKVHVVAYSFAGVDTRCAISLQGLDAHVLSLTTLCTPHHGLTLVDKAKNFPNVYGDLTHSEKAFEALGMSIMNVAEFTSKNMKAFNEVASDAAEIDYYSFGAKRREFQLSELLRANF